MKPQTLKHDRKQTDTFLLHVDLKFRDNQADQWASRQKWNFFPLCLISSNMKRIWFVFFWFLCMCWPHSLAFLSHVFICLFPWEESQRPTLSGFPSALKLCSEGSSTVFATEPVSSKKTLFERDVHINRVSVHLYLPDSNCHTHVSKRQPFSSPEGVVSSPWSALP